MALEKAKVQDESEVFGDPKKEKVYYKYMDPRQVPQAGYKGDNGSWVKGIEDFVPVSQYNCEDHHKAVIQDIEENWMTLSRGGKFHAILATSSIPEAIEYYRLFKAAGSKLKIAVQFDQSIDNTDGAIVKEDAIIEMLTDYNQRYQQSYSIPTYAQYKKDVSLRLAHKRPPGLHFSKFTVIKHAA